MTRILLCTDLDRTLLPNGEPPESEGARAAFSRLARRREVTFACVTGRHRALIEGAITTFDLPAPDYAVGDVGTSLYAVRDGAWEPVQAWTQTFAEDWAFATHESLTDDAYFPNPECVGDSVVQVLPSGPAEEASSLGQVVFAAVSTARESIRIATPYFVPSAGLRMALTHARYRGVRVRLVLPTRSDLPFVLWAGRSFYPELLDAGVEIYEFDGGMLHSKIVTVDDRWCMLGTANMDIRSFRLNFEITALLYDRRVTAELSAAIERHCEHARRIRPRDVWKRAWPLQLFEGAARLFAPLL
jgi:cardiolipin synthase